MKKIFVITYQPKEKSDKAVFVEAFINEAKNKKNEVKILNLNDIEVGYLKFDANTPDTTLSDDLKQAQDDILWADQIVLIYSVWCLNIPAKLKAFIERVFQADILVKSGKMGPEPLLKNKTIILMQSYSMPHFFMKYFYGDLPFKFIKTVFEKWCGFKIVKRFDIDMVDSIDEKRQAKIIKNIKNFFKII